MAVWRLRRLSVFHHQRLRHPAQRAALFHGAVRPAPLPASVSAVPDPDVAFRAAQRRDKRLSRSQQLAHHPRRRHFYQSVLAYGTAHSQRVEPDLRGDFLQPHRSEEHTSELQSLMRISYAVFCLKKKKTNINTTTHHKYSN